MRVRCFESMCGCIILMHCNTYTITYLKLILIVYFDSGAMAPRLEKKQPIGDCTEKNVKMNHKLFGPPILL